MKTVIVLVEASRGATPSETTPVVLVDAGVENVNAQVDNLIAMGVLRRVLAFTELRFSNSMIEAWWRFLKQRWLYLHPLDTRSHARQADSPAAATSPSNDTACAGEWRLVGDTLARDKLANAPHLVNGKTRRVRERSRRSQQRVSPTPQLYSAATRAARGRSTC